MLTANMLDYRVPTIQDSPPIEVGIVESNDPHGPFGAKEAGEGSLAAFLPALTNAIADATGMRFNDLPVTPDRVFAAIEKRRRAKSGNGGESMRASPVSSPRRRGPIPAEHSMSHRSRHNSRSRGMDPRLRGDDSNARCNQLGTR
jgi:hypothetical protein